LINKAIFLIWFLFFSSCQFGGGSSNGDFAKRPSLENTNSSSDEINIPTVESNTIPVVTGDKNIDLGFNYWSNIFNIDDRYLSPELPEGCDQFDETFYVDQKAGNELNNGLSTSMPLKTINQALSLISSSKCSLISVGEGTYKEVLDFAYGEKDKTTIFGEDRNKTTILSKLPMSGWIKLTNIECPGGFECNIYKKEFNEEKAQNFHMHYKDKIITPVHAVGQYSFREKIQSSDLLSGILPNDDDEDGMPDYKVTDNLKTDGLVSGLTESGREKFKNHMLEIMMSDAKGFQYVGSAVLDRGDLSFSGIDGIYYIHVDLFSDDDPLSIGHSTIYFRPLDNEVEPEYNLSAHLGYSIFIRDSSRIVIQNLTIKNGRYNTYIYRNSNHIKLIGNIYEGGYRNIYINGGAQGGNYYAPSNITVKGNQITNSLSLNTDPQSLGHYRNFFLIKQILTDVHGIFLYNAGENIEIKNNFIYGVSNGVQSYNSDLNFIDTNLNVHHNLIINVIDDALEPGGLCKSCRWHHNHIRNAAQSIRLKLKDSYSEGPVFIYKNITMNSDKFSYNEDKTLFHNSNTEVYFHTGSTVPIYFYNNIFNGSRCLLMPTGGNVEEAGKNFYMINNIFNCRYSIGKQRVGAYPSGIVEGEKNLQILFSHNWFGGEYDDRSTWQDGRLYLDDHEMFTFDGTNIRETSAEGEIGLSFFGKPMGQNSLDNFLERTDFCQKNSLTSLAGLDVSDSFNLHWRYNDTVIYSSTTYVHEIDRRITDSSNVLMSLPGAEGSFIGAFEGSSSNCNELEWLLPN